MSGATSTTGTKTSLMRSATRWIGGLVPLRLLHQSLQAGQDRLRRDSVDLATRTPLPLRVPPVTGVARAVLDGERLPRQHRLVDR